jgi:tryptophan synthase alpha chain
MNRITAIFRSCSKTGKKVFIPYITAGDHDLGSTAQLLDFFAGNGADMIELGVPFSDPVADGPVIQRAMERALKAGTTVGKVLETAKVFRMVHETPLVLMGYYNPFLAYGIERFARDARGAGVDGILTVDLPPEESGEFAAQLREKGLFSIYLATPVTDAARMRIIGRSARGFVYFVSVTGVTGERQNLSEDIKKKMEEIRHVIRLPVVLGFGISTPAVIRQFAAYTDGFVVGSALVKRWEAVHSGDGQVQNLHEYFREMAAACHEASSSTEGVGDLRGAD